MGLLDDAIREHLDLKRRRGADPAEIERAEHEALGPVRRKGGETLVEEVERELDTRTEPDQAGRDEYDAGVSAAYDEPDEGIAADLADGEPGLDEPPPRLSFAGEEVEEDGEEDEGPLDDDAHETRVMRIPDADPAPPAAPEPRMSDATAEYDVEDALAAEQDGGDDDEDVLEETPEFLQDTPDHDRLWFEQRPPRDFDFDG
jgi:hypothetical protein